MASISVRPFRTLRVVTRLESRIFGSLTHGNAHSRGHPARPMPSTSSTVSSPSGPSCTEPRGHDDHAIVSASQDFARPGTPWMTRPSP